MHSKILTVRPFQLMCLICRHNAKCNQEITDLLAQLRADPAQPLCLVCPTDSVYSYANPGIFPAAPEENERFQERRDLTILQRLGLVPGDTRPAIDIFERLFERIPEAGPICSTGATHSPTWKGCPRANSGAYEEGIARGLATLLPSRTAEQKAKVKRISVDEILAANELAIRPHHLLCMTCFHCGREAEDIEPIQEDNLAEAIQAMQKRPDIPVRLVRGCCMICPPCSRYEPSTNRCLGGRSMALRDQKKDLDVLHRLDLDYDAALPARELLSRLYSIRSTTEICGNGDGIARSPEWSICGGPEGNAGYPLARAMGLGVPGVRCVHRYKTAT